MTDTKDTRGLLREALAWIEGSKEPAVSLCADIRALLSTPSVDRLTDEQILAVGREHFRDGHDPKAEPAFIAAVRGCFDLASAPVQADELDVDDLPTLGPTTRALLLNVLWHNQGGNSVLGQAMRKLIGIERFARMSDSEVRAAKRIEDAINSDAAPSLPAGDGLTVTEAMMAAGGKVLIGAQDRPGDSWADEAKRCLEAMILAAPRQPEQKTVPFFSVYRGYIEHHISPTGVDEVDSEIGLAAARLAMEAARMLNGDARQPGEVGAGVQCNGTVGTCRNECSEPCSPASAQQDEVLPGEFTSAEDLITALNSAQQDEREAFQMRVQPWMMACFGAEISGDRVERGDRLLEEVLELLQSGGYDPARVISLRDYVWGRPAGEPAQEVGGVMVTLAAYCLAHNLDMHAAGETELARIWTKVEQIRAKQAAKPKHSPLPQQVQADAAADAREILPGWEFVARNSGEWVILPPTGDYWAASTSTPTGDLISAIVSARAAMTDQRTGGAENTAPITANPAANSEHAQIIARAVAAHGRRWPEQLTSGVMFYEGERITKAEFLAEVRG